MRQFIVRAAIISLAVALACQVAAALDEGSWLSQKYDLAQVDPILIEKAQAAGKKVLSGQDALGDLAKLIDELDSELKQNRSNGLLSLKAEVHMDRASALWLAYKPIETLVEIQKAESICREAGCTLEPDPNEWIHSIEDQLKVAGNYAVLGLREGASASEVSQARNSLYKLVHPDKNMSTDPETRAYLSHLFKWVDAAAKAIQN